MDTPRCHWQTLLTNRPRCTHKGQQSTLHAQQRCPPGERIRTTLVQCLCVKLTRCSQGKICFLTIICRSRRLYSLQYTTNYDQSGGCCNKRPPRHFHSTGRRGSGTISGKNSINDDWDDDLICTTPRLCQNNMTPVALRGRGTTSAYNCFPATGLYFKSRVLVSVGRGSTETTRLQHGSSMFGDTHAKGGGSSDKHGYMAFLILAKWEWQVEDLCRPDNAPC